MTMIYDPIPFVKLVQKILVVNYEPIMRIGGKIFIINFHNLQMLFMLRIKNEFSECLSRPPAKTWRPLMEDFLATVCRGPQTRWGIRGQLPPNLFVPPKFRCTQKNLFQTHDKHLNLSPTTIYFAPQTLKPGYGPGSAIIVSAIRIFCFEGH